MMTDLVVLCKLSLRQKCHEYVGDPRLDVPSSWTSPTSSMSIAASDPFQKNGSAVVSVYVLPERRASRIEQRAR